MYNQSTPKIDSFRAIVSKAATLHAELTTLDTAISTRDAIKTRMGDSRDEAEARKFLGELTSAEESVTVKQVREPRLKADLADTVAQAERTFHDAFTEVENMLSALAESSVLDFRDLLQSIQPEEENRKRDEANKVTLAAVVPAVLTQRLRDDLDNSWRAMSGVTKDPFQGVNGVKTALAIMDEIIASQPQVHAVTRRMAASCDAFRKVFAKG
jgi:hypothetical protein